MKAEHSRCLVLNGDYSPLGIIDWKKAITLTFKDNSISKNIEVLNFYENDFIQGINNTQILIPSVIRTIKYFRLNQRVNFSRNNLFIRDNYTCQYCARKLYLNELTYDHVIPKSQWLGHTTPTCWTNIVTSCRKCNAIKGNRTPLQAHMKLINQPHIPKRSSKYLPVYRQVININNSVPKDWVVYLG